MQLSDGPCFSSVKSNSKYTEFKVTLLNDNPLLVRLSRELTYVFREFRWAITELRENPKRFVRLLLLRVFSAVKQQLTPANLLGLTSACFVIGSLVVLVVVLDRTRQPKIREVSQDDSTDPPIMLVLTPGTRGETTIYPPSIGRVGLSRGRGEGSAPEPARATGGGSGGMQEPIPAQIGKVAPPSPIPAPIPKDVLKVARSLPAAGVDIDPLLWSDIKFPSYGDPRSQSFIKSNGPGEDGGMGTNKGFGVGDGRGNGYGLGNNGNTGGGDRGIGYGTSGGRAGGVAGQDTVVRLGEVDQKVHLLSKPEPHYTEEARRSSVTGTVVLQVIFSSTGEITQIHAVHTLPFGLTERAIAAAREIKFVPAMKGGRPVSVYMQLEYNFNLY
ncbi:MAG TPA: energy transducer TonB [Pyrinomonadaceae bacterium]|jgi:TonB family protein